jgi:hypothetical protein
LSCTDDHNVGGLIIKVSEWSCRSSSDICKNS